MVDWDLVLIVHLAEEEENLGALRQKRRFWVNKLWRQRCTFGEFNNLFNDLRYDARKFYDYYRMDNENFKALVALLRHYIIKKPSTFRSCISVEERLSVCSMIIMTRMINFSSVIVK